MADESRALNTVAPELAAKLQLGVSFPGELLASKAIEAWITGRITMDTDIRREYDLVGVRFVKRIEVVCNFVWDSLGFPKVS